ncbi:MAG: HAMP domain-containing histidine kinase [Chloroflexota bacterium]|nr:HAMP domain-containing histidine kinase [Chloroflexota bacterium]
MPTRAVIDDLLAVPMAALLTEPMRAGDLAAAVSANGIQLSVTRAADLLARLETMGLARVAGYEDGEARYVATSLGQRAADSLLVNDPALRVGLEELERLRTDLLATVGHELRTPLTAIRTSVGLLLDPGLEPTDAQRQQLLGTIGRSADRMQRLLTELLDLARLRAGRIEMQRVRFDARELAREVAVAIEPMAAVRGQLVRLELGKEPLPIEGDRRRLEQALLNLAANAQKFSPSGSDITIAVSGEEGNVVWSVTDAGPGIGPEEQARLFERFFVGNADQSRAGGTGIGLPTALAIAQAHSGTIEVDSAVGRGSTFRLVVPGARP